MKRRFSFLRSLLAATLSISSVLVIAQPASANPQTSDVTVAVAQAKAQPELREANRRTFAQSRQLVNYSDSGLNEEVIRRYNRYVSNTPRGEFTARLPLLDRWFDRQGTEAVTRAITASNNTVRAQLHTLQRQGITVQAYRYGDPLPMGPHATFTPLWWGMVFTLDATAAGEVNRALGDLVMGGELVDIVLAVLGAVVATEVKAAFAIVLKVMKWVASYVKNCTTDKGLVFKSLWAPIVWCERPTAPFRPAR